MLIFFLLLLVNHGSAFDCHPLNVFSARVTCLFTQLKAGTKRLKILTLFESQRDKVLYLKNQKNRFTTRSTSCFTDLVPIVEGVVGVGGGGVVVGQPGKMTSQVEIIVELTPSSPAA